MSIESEHDLIALQRIGRIVALAREEMLSSVRAGVTTAELDRIGKRELDEHFEYTSNDFLLSCPEYG